MLGSKLRISGLCLLVGAIPQSAQELRPASPLHFFVEDHLLASISVEQWKKELTRLTQQSELLLCAEMKKTEKTKTCDVSLQRTIVVTPFEKTFEDGFRTASTATQTGDADEKRLDFLLDQTDPSERRIYLVHRLRSCGGENGWTLGCTRVSGPATVLALGWPPSAWPENTITLLHELGHQAGLGDRTDPSLLMYAGQPMRRLGTRLRPQDVPYFRRLFSPPMHGCSEPPADSQTCN